jgi:hypothetical protein
LRGGWAIDFLIGKVTRIHSDYPEAVGLAKEWVKLGKLKDYQHLNIEGVYNMMVNELSLVKK